MVLWKIKTTIRRQGNISTGHCYHTPPLAPLASLFEGETGGELDIGIAGTVGGHATTLNFPRDNCEIPCIYCIPYVFGEVDGIIWERSFHA